MFLTVSLLLFAFACVAMTIRWPWSIAIPFALTHFGGDGFGVASYLINLGFGGLLYIIRALTIGAMIHCTYIICRESLSTPSKKPAALLSLLAVIGSAWIWLAWIAKGGDFWSSFNAMLYPALAVLPICLAMKPHRLLQVVLSLVAIQLLVSALVTYAPQLPFMSEISGHQYTYQDLPGTFGMNAAPELGRLSGGERPQAQMNNTNSLGLYAVLGICIGLFSITGMKGKWRLLGLLCFTLSIVIWYLTISRGSTAGLFFGVILYSLSAAIINRKNKGEFYASLVVNISGIAFLYLAFYGYFNDLISFDFERDATYTYRIDAIKYGIDAIYMWPVFGAPNFFQWPYNIAPHQLPIYFASSYGIISGLIISYIYIYIIFLLILSILNYSHSMKNYKEIILSSAIIGTFFGNTMTNNLASPVILWMTFALASQILIGTIYLNPRKQH